MKVYFYMAEPLTDYQEKPTLKQQKDMKITKDMLPPVSTKCGVKLYGSVVEDAL